MRMGFVSCQVCTARWEQPPPGTCPVAELALQVGPITADISGSLGATASMPTRITPISTTYGSSPPPQANGHGWGVAAPGPSSATEMDVPECTARWERLLLETCREAALALRA